MSLDDYKASSEVTVFYLLTNAREKFHIRLVKTITIKITELESIMQ